jgi:hypothetical protein
MHVAPTIVDAPDVSATRAAVDGFPPTSVPVPPAVVLATLAGLSGFLVGCLVVGLLWLLV